MATEQFHSETADLLKTLDEAVRLGGVSRGQAFDDFLQMAVCAPPFVRMVDQYFTAAEEHSEWKPARHVVTWESGEPDASPKQDHESPPRGKQLQLL